MSKPCLLPDDYLERVYAGVLGKLIGVYVGRPFEGWTHQRILKELGHIRYYVHEQFGDPLVITDDDVSGTFQFVRALEEHGMRPDITSEEIGKTWLNNVVEYRTIFWFGGLGMSTEHTAFLNLKKGIPAPLSGAIQTNGKTIAEQIGAQIFIDGWALVAPGNPKLAARLAKAAGSVSHDGESVFAAQVWAAMESEAFVSKDINHVLDTGLAQIPDDSLLAKVIGDVREWVQEDQDWLKTRQRIEDTYGYDKFKGVCHVIPNHAIMIMAVLYSPNDFDEAMHIINTCGWDTDCNSGNVGCLVATMMGLSAFEGRQDWRGPLADRALISSADSGYSINNAARIALDIANMGRQLAGHDPLPPPKDGAQFHFTLPGSVQGFQVLAADTAASSVAAKQEQDPDRGPGLVVKVDSLEKGSSVEVSTETYTPKSVLKMKTYDLVASPLLYPGQTVTAEISSNDATGRIHIGLRLQVYSEDDHTIAVDGPSVELDPDASDKLTWTIPDDMDSQPIQRIGLAIKNNSGEIYSGAVRLDHLRWDGVPKMTLRKPSARGSSFWHHAWVPGTSAFQCHDMQLRSFSISQSKGEGIISHGTREWTDYRAHVPDFTISLGGPAGLAARVQGLNRYYALMFVKGGRVALVKALDGERITLTSAAFDWVLDEEYAVTIEVDGDEIKGRVGGVQLATTDSQYGGGGVGLIVTEGALLADSIDICPLR